MPFDFVAYDQKCAGLTAEELQREWQHYTRLITGAATSTTVSGLALPLTLGVSSVGIAMAAPAIHNARKKREIIERHLQRHNAHHVTRKRDVLGGAAVSGTIGVVTLGVGTMGADVVAQQGAEHGINAIVANETAIKVVTHAALDGVGMGVEHMHTNHIKKREAKKAFEKAGVFQAVDEAKAKEAGYAVVTQGQQQHPYSLQAQHTGASSSRLSFIPPPPPYSPGQEPPVAYQQSTQYQPTAMNVPAYYMNGQPQYATLDAKIDPYGQQQQQQQQLQYQSQQPQPQQQQQQHQIQYQYQPQQPQTQVEWASSQYAPADATSQPAGAFDMKTLVDAVPPPSAAANASPPHIPRKEVAKQIPVAASTATDTQYMGPGTSDMDELYADIQQQLSKVETNSKDSSDNIDTLSYRAGPVVTHYELPASVETPPLQVAQHLAGSGSPQPAATGEAGQGQVHQCAQPAETVCGQCPVPFQSEVSPQPPQASSNTQYSESQSTQTQLYENRHQTPVSPEQPPLVPQSTVSSYHSHHDPSTSIVQPVPTHGTAPPIERYIPTPMTPQSYGQSPQPHHNYQQGQIHASYVSTPATPQPYQHQQPHQPQTYFSPPPWGTSTPPIEPSGSRMSKRKSIMAAVALKATQTLSQHRTPSAASYNKPQYSQSPGQSQQYHQVQQQQLYQQQPHQYQTQQEYQPQPQVQQVQQQWSQPQQSVVHSPQQHQPANAVEEPVYAPVPVPQAYSTRPQSQVFPPTPLSPPNIPTVQGYQQQQPGYFPPPTESKAGYACPPANGPMTPMATPSGHYQGYLPQQ